MIKKFIGFFALILILHNCVLLVVTSHVDTDLNEIVSRSEREYHEKPHVRETRYAKPLSGIFGFFSTLGSITQIFSEVCGFIVRATIDFLIQRNDFFSNTSKRRVPCNVFMTSWRMVSPIQRPRRDLRWVDWWFWKSLQQTIRGIGCLRMWIIKVWFRFRCRLIVHHEHTHSGQSNTLSMISWKAIEKH